MPASSSFRVGREFVTASRYVVGIDLGTTNSALAYVDTGAAEGADAVVHHMPVPQVVNPGAVDRRSIVVLTGPSGRVGLRTEAPCLRREN